MTNAASWVRKITYFGCWTDAAAQNRLLWLLLGPKIAVTAAFERDGRSKTAGRYKRRMRKGSGNDGFPAAGAAKVGEIAQTFSPGSQSR